jgi:hypothetical protein
MPAPLEATMFAIIPSRPEVGDMSAKVWPHVSVVPWVQLGEYRHEVLAEAQAIVQRRMPLSLKPGGMTVVGGEGHEKPAQRIISEQLGKLHRELLYSLGSFGIMVSHPEWAGNNYKPHITTSARMLRAEAREDTLYVIDNQAVCEGHQGTKIVTARLTADS